MTTPKTLSAVAATATDLRHPQRTTGSRKPDTNFAGFMEEQRAAQAETPQRASNEVRGSMNHAPLVTYTEATSATSQTPTARQIDLATGLTAASAPASSPAGKTGVSGKARMAPPPVGIPLDPALRRVPAQVHQQATAATPPTPPLSVLSSLMTDTTPGSIGHLMGKGSQAVRAVLTGDMSQMPRPRGIALAPSNKGIALDATTQQQLARASNAGKTVSAPRVASSARTNRQEEIGKLAAQFESGSDGIAAIGYDRNGGTSYGKYQIASRPGTMSGFVQFLQEEAPDVARRLATAGPANTGSRNGTMPKVWRELASEDPQRFEALQERFIHESHYLPAQSALTQYGYQPEKFSAAMQEVLFSTAVQHGPAGASRIFGRAAERVGLSSDNQQRREQQLIKEIYTLRADQFGSSTPQVQVAVRKRMAQEQQLAMAMSRQNPVAA